ncbi:MAG: hypothetical protein IJX47_08080 [Clostridia bacterium]|nr:hypothetical protein [Clostridia bacterium]
MMKAYKWIALLLTGVLLTACNAGTAEVTTVAPSESGTTTARKTTASDESATSFVGTGPGGCGINPAGVTGDEREKLLAGKTGIVAAGMIDPDSFRVIGATEDTAAGVKNLFDGTEAQWHCLVPGDTTQTRNPVWVIFAATEPVTVTAYEMITGTDLAQNPSTNPMEWYLYGTNDPAALTAEDPETVEWVVLDYVYDGMLDDVDLLSYGIPVDEAKQGEYLYYAWVAGYTSDGEFRLSELELYITP